MWHRGSSNTYKPTNCWARNRSLVLIKCFEVLLMSKPKWPPISSYEIVKTSDEKYKTQLRLLVYSHTQLWYYVPTHYLAPLQTILQTMTIYNDNEYAYYLIAIRYVADNKYIQKFWKQTIAGDTSLCYVIITLSYITLTLQIVLQIALQYNRGSDWLSACTEWSL